MGELVVTPSVDARRQAFEGRLEDDRAQTRRLLAPLSRDDLEKQHDPIMSPLVWDVGHVANFEELWLLREVDGRPPHDPRLDQVYNPFENPRWVRGDLDFLDTVEAGRYMDEVRAEALEVLRHVEFDPEVPLLDAGYVYAMVAQHEVQHQETMLQAMDLRGDLPPYTPALDRRLPNARQVDDEERVVIPGGTFDLGTDDRSVAYDNERPRHVVGVPEFVIDRYPVTVRRFAAFVDAGGYDEPEWWSDAGWSWCHETGCDAPQGWERAGDGWLVRRFGHRFALDPAEIVQHVSYWEAEAFCRWAGGRLPTEVEWEKAARWDPRTDRSRTYPWGDDLPTPQRANLDRRGWGPSPAGAYPKGASAYGVEQMIGDVFEWTSSDFVGYPGYSSFPYKEYSEVFFGDEYKVLRGASWATASLAARASFRNWDYQQRRQIFSGIRVAYDAPGPRS